MKISATGKEKLKTEILKYHLKLTITDENSNAAVFLENQSRVPSLAMCI
jgi:hypothetical protein